MEDLFQIGCIGLMKAIDKFDLHYEVRFSTYAVPMIQGEIKRFLRDDGMVKVSRTLKENGWKIKQAAERLSQKLGREATLKELSEATGLETEDIVMALDANVEVESIYKSVYQSDGNEIYLVDQIAGKNNEREKLLNHMLLSQLHVGLEGEDKELILLRYFRGRHRWMWRRDLESVRCRSAGWKKEYCAGCGRGRCCDLLRRGTGRPAGEK